jgi:4-oxalocrotonate tautomerase
MSGDVPDVRGGGRADDGGTAIRPDKENSMPLIQVTLIAGVFTAPQKQEIIERLTDAMVAIEGEAMRSVTWCLVEEVASGEWGLGGQTVTADDFKALARGGVAAGTDAAPSSPTASPTTPRKPL